MNSIKKKSRIAGLLYLLLGITGAFGLMYVPSRILVHGDAVATANNITTYELLFRLGIVSNLICQVIFVFLVLALYRLFKEVNKNYAVLMVVLVLVSVPVTFLNVINQIAPLVLLSGADYLKVFNPEQLQSLVLVFLEFYQHGIYAQEIFWGLWLFPLGFLVYKSDFIPKIFGIWLIIGCFGYVADSIIFLLSPGFHETIPVLIITIASSGELVIILWLLIIGVRGQKLTVE